MEVGFEVLPATTVTAMSSTAPSDGAGELVNCGSGGGSNDFYGLRIASIFVILVTSLFGTLLPILLRSKKSGRIRRHLFECVLPVFI